MICCLNGWWTTASQQTNQKTRKGDACDVTDHALLTEADSQVFRPSLSWTEAPPTHGSGYTKGQS